jgi:hypothetical protein
MDMKSIQFTANLYISMKILVAVFLIFSFRMSYAAESYEVQASVNDESFLINGEKFKAKTFCFNMEQGDQVIFMVGSPLGVCATATLYNIRTRRTCEVWCGD